MQLINPTVHSPVDIDSDDYYKQIESYEGNYRGTAAEWYCLLYGHEDYPATFEDALKTAYLAGLITCYYGPLGTVYSNYR